MTFDGLETGTPPSGATRGLDGSVNFADALSISSYSEWLEVATNATAYDNNGTVTIATAGNTFQFDGFFEPLVPASSAPEPASAALLGLGLAALVLRKRR